MAELGTATNKKLLDVFNMIKDGSLILRPSFQRKLVWNNNHKENFIETILLQLPFPEVYFADGEIDLQLQKSTTLVVDGQQRLSTIYQYVTGSNDFPIKRINKFSALTPVEQTNFYDYKIVVRDLGRLDDEAIKEIFQRINSVQYALNAVEIQNALYEGEFIKTAKEIVEEDKVVRGLFDVFSEVDFSRMKDLEFMLLAMSSIEENSYFNGNKLVDEYVKKFDPDYPNSNWMKNNIRQVFKLISDCQFKPDSIWFRKSSFFTLVVELLKYLKTKGFLPTINSTLTMLNIFEQQIYVAKSLDVDTNRFSEYYYYTFQGTNGKTGRTVRGKLLMEHLNKLT